MRSEETSSTAAQSVAQRSAGPRGSWVPGNRAARRYALGRRGGLILSALCVIVAAGCHAPRAGKPVEQKLAGSDPDAQVEFWHSLTDDSVTSNDQAFHGLLLYADGKDDSASYTDRVHALKTRGMLPYKFNEPPEQGVTRGTVAVALLKLLNEKGGVTLHVLGPTPRYAVRELMFLNLYPPSAPSQSFSGNEFVGIIGRVEDYQRGNPADVPAAVMPSEMNNPAAATQPVRE